MKRLKKECKLDVCNHMVLKYGTINKENPQVIYISGKCWISPLIEMDYERVISYIEQSMKKNIKRLLIDGINFENKLILDFETNTEGLSPSMKTFLSFDFYLKQNEKNKKNLLELNELLKGKVSTISNNLVYLFRENNFSIEKKKRM